MGHTLQPDGQARPALGQDTQKATEWAAGPETRLCDQIASRNLHGNSTGFYKDFLGPGGDQPTWLSKRPESNYGVSELAQTTEKATKLAAGPKNASL